MANWYWCSNNYGSTAAGNFTIEARNASGYIRYFNGKAYGTLENPYTRMYYNSTPSSWRGQYIVVEYPGGTFYLMSDADAYVPYALVRTTSKINNSNFLLQDVTTISGKYRLHDTITPSRNCHVVPVNFAIYNNISNEYDYCNAFANTYLYGARGYSTSQNTAILKEGVTYSPISLSDSNGVTVDKYTQSIIDFGTLEQEVPQFFKTWIETNADAIYPYTFTVKQQNGDEVLATLSEAPAMVDVTPSAIGNVKTLTMTGVNGRTYTMTWESETPAGKQFLGLAYDANETRASIPTGRTTPVTWDSSLTLYEVYGTYRPPVTTFDINLYQSSAEVNRVDKTAFLTGVGTLSGVLREECSIIAPSITFKQTTVPTFNYVYIAAFSRYYYVTGITSVSKDLWRMSLSCDVLMTWKDDIRALTAIIARQENSFNPLLLDSELPAQANQNITVTEFPAGGFGTSESIEHPFLLTVVGA